MTKREKEIREAHAHHQEHGLRSHAAHWDIHLHRGELLAALDAERDKLRWRDCETEPPTANMICVTVLVRVGKTSGGWYEPFTADYDGVQWTDVEGWRHYPSQWRPIE